MKPGHSGKLENLPLPELEKYLNTSLDGISQIEAQARLEKYGYNELVEIKKNPYLKFLTYFWGPIPWMIEVAAVLSAIVHHWADFGIILTLLVVNAIVGFWEENQADNTIAALKKQLPLQARVKRDRVWETIPARELVPGDLIHLRIGDIIPADTKLVAGTAIKVDQSALTGESLPVEHQMEDTVFSGSNIRQGEMDGLVLATGKDTYFGKTANLVESTQKTSHFQKAVLKIGDYLIILAVALVVIILIASLFRGDPMLTTLEFALILTIAAIPVAMPTVLSVTMAVGARFLAQKKAIVSHLSSIEELAGIDILCSDKTGTLTQNKLSLGDPFIMDGVDANQLIISAALASRSEDQDSIDLAVFSGLHDLGELANYTTLDFQPFDPIKKRTEATIRGPGNQEFKVTKGAPQVILALVDNPVEIQKRIEPAINEFARRGFRSLAVAHSSDHGEWQLLGILTLYDPPRADSKETIEAARNIGIQVKMITGDQIEIGREIASQLGLGNRILDAESLEATQQHKISQIADAIEESDGFAQVYPEHKYHIVDVLQQRGHIVGMTGDGVNDAPALKKANAGIAVSGATDAARSAADIILLTPGLSVIIDAIKESRKIFQRMNSYAIYRIAETIRVLLFMTLSILVFNFYPVTAVMIVLLALLNDGAILSIAFDRAYYSKEPETWEMPKVLGIASILGISGVIGSFGLFYLAERTFQLSPDMIQTMMYLKLSVAGHLTIFITRTRGPFWSRRPAPILIGAVAGTQLIATLIAVYGLFMNPIGWGWAFAIWGYALIWFFINDRVKIAAYRIFDKDAPGLLSHKSYKSLLT